MKKFCKMLKAHKEWWLPIFTTFLGVLLAASAAIYLENRKSDKFAIRLLEVAKSDTCVSWLESEYQSNNPKVGVRLVAHIPEVAITILIDNATLLGEFHPDISIELVRLISGIQIAGSSFNYIRNQVDTFETLIQAGPIDDGMRDFAVFEIERLKLDAQENHEEFNRNVAWASRMLYLEHSMRTGVISKNQLELEFHEEYEVPCVDPI